MTSNNVVKLSDHADLTKLTEEDGLYAKDKGMIVKPFKMTAADDTQDYNLYAVKYNKRSLTPDNTRTLGLWRSIVTDGKNILSVAPAKAVPALHFGVWEESGALHTTFLEEFVEGTMINTFWDPHAGAWELATRSNIGARCSFFEPPTEDAGASRKSFRDMFIEAMAADGLDFAALDETCSYSFVLQHPDNRIVAPFVVPHLVLVAVYRCGAPGAVQELGINADTCPWLSLEGVSVGRPRTIQELFPNANAPLATVVDVERYLRIASVEYTIVGVVAHGLGAAGRLRAKVRNPSYEQVRLLRGNNPKNQFCYYSLRARSRVGDFLKYYPEYRRLFDIYRDDLYSWTARLYECYVEHRIQKKGTLQDYPYEFRPHLRVLHRHFLNELRPAGRRVTHSVVAAYVNCLPPPRLMYAINYHLRRQKRDAARKPAQSHA